MANKPTKLERTMAQLRSSLPSLGFTVDAFGHYKKPSMTKAKGEPGKPDFRPAEEITLRIKMQNTSVRVECKRPGFGDWYKLGAAYMKDISFVEDGSVKIGKFHFSKPDGA